VKKQIVKVGFDLDGVILYNPVRGARFLAFFLKKILFKSKVNKFFIPKTKLHKALWYLLHKTSVFPSKGYDEIIKMIKHNKIKAYIISGRYRFLKNDFNDWVEKLNMKKYFEGLYMNNKDEQPYFFKEKMINRLGLDVFIEDNWDIIKQLNKTAKKAKIFWLTNIVDRKIKYKYKFSNLKRAVKYLQENVINK
jgi:hypothetical protein